eukprot:30268-Eustigmatos_ZCMA.PRE.1
MERFRQMKTASSTFALQADFLRSQRLMNPGLRVALHEATSRPYPSMTFRRAECAFPSCLLVQPCNMNPYLQLIPCTQASGGAAGRGTSSARKEDTIR